jgi:hypothetical protein
MKHKTIGLGLFWISAAYMIAMGFIASFGARSAYRFMTLDQVRETIWTATSPIFGLWATAIPIGAILAGVGVLVYVRAKGTHIWLFGVGIFAVLLLDILSRWGVLPEPSHSPRLFGIGGGLITIFFLGILWYWAKERKMLDDPAATAADIQLVGYVFLLIAMWYLCGALSRPFQKALVDLPPDSPVPIIVYLVLGWLFLFLSHFKSAQAFPKQV